MSTQNALEHFDGINARTVFCLWTGNELLSDNRLKAIWTIFVNIGCSVSFVNKNTIQNWIDPEHPLHPAWPYLSSTHKADYLRCYLMHYYGGGYTDIKQTTKSWWDAFDRLENSDKLALGYTELATGVAPIDGDFGKVLKASYKELIGVCAFVFKRKTPLSTEWLARTERLLDEKLPALREHPAQHALDRNGLVLPNGETSLYPLRWVELLGEIFHPLVYEFRDQIMHAPIEPVFTGYR